MPVVLLTENNIQPFCIAPQYVFIPTRHRVTTSHLQHEQRMEETVTLGGISCNVRCYTRPVILTGMDTMTSERRTKYP